MTVVTVRGSGGFVERNFAAAFGAGLPGGVGAEVVKAGGAEGPGAEAVGFCRTSATQ